MLGDRLMVGQEPLKLLILVRAQVPQQGAGKGLKKRDFGARREAPRREDAPCRKIFDAGCKFKPKIF